MPFRAFVAVPAPADPPLVSLLEGLAALDADVKPVEPGNLHFTLSFLGDVADDATEPLGRALARACRHAHPFTLRLQGVGAFPSARRPRVVWVGVEDARPIAALATRVREELRAAGFDGDDKDFRAHLTLARVRSERGLDALVRFLQAHGHDAPGEVAVDHVSLYRSRLGPAGPTYDAVATARLEA